MLAEIITIGDEILIGQIVDTNSAWMARELNKIGLGVKQVTSVSDNSDHIIEALSQAEKRADIILITGGLGPTKDDITKKTLADYFNVGFRRDEQALKNVSDIFEKFKRPLLEVNIRQADVPSNCRVIQNKNGTAPCMWFEERGKVFVSMPGVPHEMMYMMEEDILPEIQKKFNLPVIVHHTILTSGIGESFLADQIAGVEDRLPAHIKLAYLPKLGQVRLRLSARGNDGAELNAEVRNYADQIIRLVKDHVIADSDTPIEKAILDYMEKHKLTLSVAESCTGGYISHLITQHAGSSTVFQGGAISYSYELKERMLGVKPETLQQYGAVSAEVVEEMARGAIDRYETDYSVAVSGIAGPGGGTDTKPVGTVWIAVASKTKTYSKLFRFGNKRQQNIERSAVSALTLLFKLLQRDEV